jgi:hypothetical protein
MAGNARHECRFIRSPYGQTIYIHRPCVEQWYLGLLRDALELKYEGKSCWNQLTKDMHNDTAKSA